MTTPDPTSPPADAPKPFEPGHEPSGLAGLPPFIKSAGGGLWTPGRSAGKGLGAAGGAYGRRPIPSLWQFLEMGSPRLALARARGVPFAPWITSIKATFEQSSPAVVPNEGTNTKYPQDMWLESAICRVTSLTTPLNQFQTLSDFFQNYQNGIECILFVQGAPRYGIVEQYTGISTVFDMVNPWWMGDFVITFDQNLEMSFQTVFPLPDAAIPLQVEVAFRNMGPVNDAFYKMSSEEAFGRLLKEFGIECSDAYMNYHCR